MKKLPKYLLIAAASLSLAAPARANDDARNVLAGLLGVALLGVVISELANKDTQVVHSAPPPPPTQYGHQNYYKPKPHNGNQSYHNGRHVAPAPRPLPRHMHQYVLPQRCLVQGSRPNNKPITLMRPACLNKHFAKAHKLPRICRVKVWSQQHNQRQDRFSVTCLQKHGYRVAGR